MNNHRNNTQKQFEEIVGSKSKSSSRRVKRSIKDLSLGDYYRGTVKVMRKVKPGPLILTVYDGSGSIDAIAHSRLFEKQDIAKDDNNTYNFGNLQIKDSRKQSKPDKTNKKGRRLSEDEIEVNQVIRILGKTNMHRNNLEIELKSIREATKDFDSIIESRSQPNRCGFSIDSQRYEDMKSMFISIASRIRQAIIEQQPILLRHHNDADGICAGLAMEQAITNVMERRDIETRHRIYRSPSPSPYYDQIDLFRDISKFSRYHEEFEDKYPLILLLDTGSTPENLFALKILKSVNFECIIIDHHNPGELNDGKSAICNYLEYHLNPYLFGWDSETCGGMLCYELARMIDEEYEQPLYPAVAGIADRSDIPEIDKYIEKTGRSREELGRMGRVIDYMAYNFRFESGDEVYEQVFTNPDLVRVIGDELEIMYKETVERMIPDVKSTLLDGLCYNEVNLEDYTLRGQYPTPGKVLGLVHDYFVPDEENQKVITFGYFSDGVIIRATHPILPVPDLLTKLQKALPRANVDGGGHEQAGSLKFIPAYEEKVKEFIVNELKNNID